MKNSAHVRKASDVEKQFWLLDQQGKSTAYNIVSAFWVADPDVGRLSQVVQAVMTDWGIGTQVYRLENGELQCVENARALETCTLSLASENFAEAAEARFREFCESKFDIENGPLAKLVTIQAPGAERAWFGIIVHHIAIDLRTKELLASEIERRWTAPEQLYSLDETYEEFVQEHAAWLQSDKADKARSYWKTQLETLTNATMLAQSTPAPSQHRAGGLFEFTLDAGLSGKLDRFAASSRIDPFILYFAAYQLTLSRLKVADQLSIGVPLSNRFGHKFENSVGCFVNTLPIVSQLDWDVSKDQYLGAVRQKFLLANRHQALPVFEIKRLLPSTQTTLFDFGFTLEPPMALDLAGTDIRRIPFYNGSAQLDVFLRGWEDEGGMCFRVEYDDAKYGHDFSRRLAAVFQLMLDGLVAEDKPLRQIPYLPAEDAQVIDTANRTQGPVEAAANLKEAFEAQVKSTPDAIALVSARGQLTYAQFDGLAGKLANCLLQQAQVAPGAIVGVYCDRSEQLLVSIYAIIKAGCAYLPLDVDAPLERTRYMLEQAQARVVVTTTANHSQLETLAVDCIALSTDYGNIEHFEAQLPPIEVSAESPAYVLFTSGSTGLPKGVVNSHRGIMNRLYWMQEYFQVQDDVILQKTPVTFDVSVWELFLPLQVGGTLAIADHNSHKDPYQLCRQIETFGVTFAHFVPAMLAVFLGVDLERPLPLKTVVCSGEELSKELQGRFFRKFNRVSLYNLYGPTEAAVDVTCWKCEGDDHRHFVPIGKPILNTQIHIVDKQGNAVPIGVPGEIMIGGVQVADGYINNPTLTDEKFFVDEFGRGRLYRTGDLAQWDQDGQIEYLGRLDFQVKINGVRIELGEIENSILSLPEIKMAVVTYKKENGIGLVAHYVPNPVADNGNSINNQASITEESIKRQLAARLPLHMLPRAFIQLATMPMTPSGKIDRKSLPYDQLDVPKAAVTSEFAPGTTERLVMDAWQSVLGKTDFAANASFFDAGGDSLKLMEVYQFLLPHLKRRIASTDMFAYPTIESLARYIDSDGEKSPDQDARIRNRAQKMKSAFKRPR
ncbi:non-ribosomal peptide synthetase [Ketobacter sp.]|uniref:non-ribosomal peptide synthetase n=1 Tax=Ketobacter sp. TaxID=2083498 RepID=UPI000F1A7968|nr:amino acid adenylation domain-containing protein [Ketobacter sp.]RLT93676.1 MAG: amino acid adenylation domain-containing protein [Ketobacter sp.]